MKPNQNLSVPFPLFFKIDGVEIYTCCTGMRYKRDDLFFAKFADKTTVAGVFTKNTMPGEPVVWCKKILNKGKARALVVNSGYSNVFCGQKGVKTVEKTVAKVAEIYGFEKDEIYISSTGIIGEPVNDELLIEALESKLKESDYKKSAIAISTTDTFPKGVYKEASIGDKKVKLAGIIKGSGMIAPNMATMLGYLFTNAKISSKVLQQLLCEATEVSYNSITVDSDTSTSDTVLAFATGKADNKEVTDINDPDFQEYRKLFINLNQKLAKLVVRDGEGATKFADITVEEAESDESARKIALAIANSPLVKTAIAGEDPNWGRIVMAIGKTAEPANRDKTNIWIGDIQAAKDGYLNPEYDESKATEYMKNIEISIKASVGVGSGKATVYTSDLTHGYIEINADYRS
jgi:glutamate N-acetyltransferase/amino-acid N-acetyltransferase